MDALQLFLAAVVIIFLLILLVQIIRIEWRVHVLETFRKGDSKVIKQLQEDNDDREMRFASMVDTSFKKAIAPIVKRLDDQDDKIAEIKDGVDTLLNRGKNEINNTPAPPSRTPTS